MNFGRRQPIGCRGATRRLALGHEHGRDAAQGRATPAASRSSVSCPRGRDDNASIWALSASLAPARSPTASRSICNFPASSLTVALIACARMPPSVALPMSSASVAPSPNPAAAQSRAGETRQRIEIERRGAQFGIDPRRAIAARPLIGEPSRDGLLAERRLQLLDRDAVAGERDVALGGEGLHLLRGAAAARAGQPGQQRLDIGRGKFRRAPLNANPCPAPVSLPLTFTWVRPGACS